MKNSIKTAFLSVAIVSMLVPLNVAATNGAWLIGFGAKSRSMGGTGVADNRGGMAAGFNPATMVDSGTRFDLGADIFIPPRKVKHEGASGSLGFTEEESNHNIFLIPNMGGTYQWKEDVTVGFAVTGAGLKTEYDQSINSDSCKRVNSGQVPGYPACPPTFFNFNDLGGPEVGVELIQMQMLPSIAYKINDQHSVGATFVIGASFFRAEGLEAFEELGFSAGTGDLTGGHWDQAFGAGLRLGWWGKFIENKIRLGVNYSSRVYMEKLEGYQNLFAEQGGFDIPESYTFGLALDFSPKFTATFDLQRINWSNVKSIGNPGPNAFDNAAGFFPLCPPPRDTNECLTGRDDGLGFGWRDQTVYKLGFNWDINEKWSARAGWNYAKSPIPSDQVLFNLLAPATPEHHLTLGAGYEFSEKYVIDASLVYAFSNVINGPTAFNPTGGPAAPGSSNASIDMTQLSIGGALGIRF